MVTEVWYYKLSETLRVSFGTPGSSLGALGVCQMPQGDKAHNGTIPEKYLKYQIISLKSPESLLKAQISYRLAAGFRSQTSRFQVTHSPNCLFRLVNYYSSI